MASCCDAITVFLILGGRKNQWQGRVCKSDKMERKKCTGTPMLYKNLVSRVTNVRNPPDCLLNVSILILKMMACVQHTNTLVACLSVKIVRINIFHFQKYVFSQRSQRSNAGKVQMQGCHEKRHKIQFNVNVAYIKVRANFYRALKTSLKLDALPEKLPENGSRRREYSIFMNKYKTGRET